MGRNEKSTQPRAKSLHKERSVMWDSGQLHFKFLCDTHMTYMMRPDEDSVLSHPARSFNVLYVSNTAT